MLSSTFPLSLEVNDLVVLRELKINDQDILQILALYLDSEVSRFLPDNFQVSSVEDARKELLYLRNLFYNRDGIFWAITLKDSDLLIGTCGFNKVDYINSKGIIGFDILQDFRKRGITYQSLLTMIRLGFDKLQLNRIELYVQTDNIASINLVTKLNFKQEGKLSQYEIRKNRYHDFYIYALLRRNYYSD